MLKKNICELARTIRSKNAGYFAVTVEIIFNDRKIYQRIKERRSITEETIAAAYDIPREKVINFHYYDPGMGIKANFLKDVASGGPGETDVYGCQQYVPLMKIDIPWD